MVKEEEEGEHCMSVLLCMRHLLQELHAVLELRLMPTEKVIASYYHELLEYQKITSANRGSVSIVVGYIEAHNQLDFTCGSGEGLHRRGLALSWNHMHSLFHAMDSA